jgi:hypothetical protein
MRFVIVLGKELFFISPYQNDHDLYKLVTINRIMKFSERFRMQSLFEIYYLAR